jgi:hypothetical protein
VLLDSINKLSLWNESDRIRYMKVANWNYKCNNIIMWYVRQLFWQYLYYFEEEVLEMAWYLSEEYVFISTPVFHTNSSLNASHDKSVFVLLLEWLVLCPHKIKTSLQTRCNSYRKICFQWMNCFQASTIKVQQPSPCCHASYYFFQIHAHLRQFLRGRIGAEQFTFFLW